MLPKSSYMKENENGSKYIIEFAEKIGLKGQRTRHRLYGFNGCLTDNKHQLFDGGFFRMIN